MSDTGGFPLVGGSPAFPGKNNVVRDSSGSNSFGWENLNVGNLSVVAGYRNKAFGSSSCAFGVSNTISAHYSFAVGNLNVITSAASLSFAIGEGNTVSNVYSSAFGQSNNISGGRSFAVGGSNTVSGPYSAACGQSHTVSGAYASCFGLSNASSATLSFSCGVYTLASRYCELAHGGVGASISGSAQHGWLVFSNQSTSATPLILYLDGLSAAQRAVLAAGARWKCTLEIIATTTGAINKSASWEYKFQIDRPTTAATTIIRTTPLLTLSDGSNAGAPPAGWSVAITADTTNGCPQIQVTGDTDIINWTACLHYVQSIRV